MLLTTNILIAIVALLHFYFLVLEMILWEKPFGLRTFGNSEEIAKITKTLAMNQGLYNGFLAAGLVWGLILGDAGASIKVFFLVCIIIAGLFAGFTVSKKILYVQAFPAIVALALFILF